jgi:CheY-like chemotaxis protein
VVEAERSIVFSAMARDGTATIQTQRSAPTVAAVESRTARCAVALVINDIQMVLRITVIEDSRETQLKLLRSLGLDVPIEMQMITAPPFLDEEIEEMVMRFGPDLIILDLLLLEGIDSGFRILRRLKASSLNSVPVVVCSKFIGSDAKDPNRRKALEYGAHAALPKIPFPVASDFLKFVRPANRNRES